MRSRRLGAPGTPTGVLASTPLHVNPRHLELAPYLAEVEQLPDHLRLASELGPTRREAAAIDARIRSSCDRIRRVSPAVNSRFASGVDAQTTDRVLRLLEDGRSISQVHRELRMHKRTVSRIATRGRSRVLRCKICGGRTKTTYCPVCYEQELERDPLFGLGERTRQVVEETGIHPEDSMDQPPAAELEIPESGWTVCVVCGPSGSGKTLAVRDYLADRGGLSRPTQWPQSSILESLSRTLPFDEIRRALLGVGLRSPVDWHKEYRQLSSSEQFRADLAYALTKHDARNLVAIDNFADSLDDQAARQLARDIVKEIRRGRLGRCRQLIAVTCRKTVAKAMRPDILCQLEARPTGTDHGSI